MSLTCDRLKQLLSYSPETGLFTRLTAPCWNIKIGDIAGGLNKDGYVRILIDGRAYMAHRLAWFYANGYWPEKEIDHINGVRSDNRICNLRDTSHSGNQQNKQTPRVDNKSGLLGVSKFRDKYSANIRVNGKNKYLGVFKTAELAHAAYVEAKRIFHPTSII